MAEFSDLEARVTSIESRIEAIAADATAARHLAAARDRDLADLGTKVDANRSTINALGQQTAAGFAEMRAGFAEMRAKLDQTAAGQQHIAELLTTLIAEQGDDQ
jgi:predicted  nucleic acid-binding Zn-ribbon protein